MSAPGAAGPPRELVHAFYTNLPGRDGRGFRALVEAADWPPADRQRVGRWLGSLVPAETAADRPPRSADGGGDGGGGGTPTGGAAGGGSGPGSGGPDGPEPEATLPGGPGPGGSGPGAWAGWALAPFRLGGVLHAAAARVAGDRSLRDEHGRSGGRLVHGLLVAVDEGRDRALHGPVLLEVADQLAAASRVEGDGPATGPEDLDAYRRRCEAWGPVSFPRVEPRELAAIEEARPGFLEALFRAASGAPGERGDGPAPFPAEAGDDLPGLLVRSAGALPPRLRLAFAWRLGLRGTAAAGGEAMVAVGRGRPEEDRPPLPPEAAAALRHLLERLAAGRDDPAADDRVRRLAEDWAIRSWTDLAREAAR